MTVTHQVQLAMSADFLKAFAALPKDIQKKTRTWIERFRETPDSKAINLESLHAMRDDKVRTARIDQKYRAVLVQPERGSMFLLVWVDNHDEAMAWAQNKVFEVNRYTGTFQVYEPVEGKVEAAAAPVGVVASQSDTVPEGFLLAGQRDEDLLLLGVPEPLLPAIRVLRTDADLDRLCPYLPHEAADAVYMLASGYTVNDVLEQFDRKEREAALAEAERVDTSDIEQALGRLSTKRQFTLVERDEDLAAMLAAPMEQWRIFLHPSQAKLIEMDSKGSARVLGGAGTGKTVVAMHRIRYLARKVFAEPSQRLLFTTFTANLAADIKDNLRRLCGPEIERIEVKHLQEVARDVLSARGIKMPPAARDKQVRDAWDSATNHTALEFSPIFYQEEWVRVVQAEDVLTLDDYLKARRAGRGQRLTRTQRRHVWEVLSEYRRALDAAGYCEHADIVREARLSLERGSSDYACVVADEIQDFRTADLKLLRALVPEGPNDIFVVGDPHQRIYGHKASLARCGISVLGRRSRKLRVNYRTTQLIRNWAVSRLTGMEFDDLDEGQDDLAGERSLRLGNAPQVQMVKTQAKEIDLIVGWIEEWLASEDKVRPADLCVCVRTRELAQDYAKALGERGIATRVIETKVAAVSDDKVRVATMHRVKGLEFARVILAGIRDATMPFRDGSYETRDPEARALYDEGEKRLLYVAATRARDELRICGWGKRSTLV